VVETANAEATVIDTAMVKAPVGGINSNGKRTLIVKSTDHGILLGILVHLLAGEVVPLHLVIKLASLSNSLVRIILLADNTVPDGIVERDGHVTTIAALVASTESTVVITIDKLLLGKGRKLLVGKEVSTLQSTSGREGPAGTTLFLVLDRSDSTLLDPVLGSRIGLVAVVLVVRVVLRHLGDRDKVEVPGGELFLRKISELSQTENSILALTVKVTNKGVVILESVVTGDVLLNTVVNLVVLHGPIHEKVIDISGGESTADEESNNNKDSLHYYYYKQRIKIK